MADRVLSECGFHGRWTCFRNWLWIETHAEWSMGTSRWSKTVSAVGMTLRMHPFGNSDG